MAEKKLNKEQKKFLDAFGKALGGEGIKESTGVRSYQLTEEEARRMKALARKKELAGKIKRD